LHHLPREFFSSKKPHLLSFRRKSLDVLGTLSPRKGPESRNGMMDPGGPVPAKAGNRGDALEGFLRTPQPDERVYYYTSGNRLSKN
jgi:hypothetical protein